MWHHSANDVLLLVYADEDEGKGKEADGKDWEKMARAADTELPGLQEVIRCVVLWAAGAHLWSVGIWSLLTCSLHTLPLPAHRSC